MAEISVNYLSDRLFDVGINVTKSSLRIILIVVAAYVLVKFVRTAFNRMEVILVKTATAHGASAATAGQRIRTLASVLWTIAVGLVWFATAMLVLGQVGFNMGPVLAGAGIVGLAVGFGAQHLIRDLVSGFFLVLEDQIRVGDTAIINGTAGLVETISFRTVVLRDLAGVVHIFPNGTINSLANTSKDWSAYIVDLQVPIQADTDRVIEIMRRVGEDLKSEPRYGTVMLEPIEIFGIDDFTDGTVNIKARFKTLPQQQQLVGREYRSRLTKALVTAGVAFQK
jgi:small-conductance mechanosensitive channel